jgi:hypothetical protein
VVRPFPATDWFTARPELARALERDLEKWIALPRSNTLQTRLGAIGDSAKSESAPNKITSGYRQYFVHFIPGRISITPKCLHRLEEHGRSEVNTVGKCCSDPTTSGSI